MVCAAQPDKISRSLDLYAMQVLLIFLAQTKFVVSHQKMFIQTEEIDEECVCIINVQSQAQMLLYPYKSYGSTTLQVVIGQMQLGNITEVITEDTLITSYGEHLLSGKGF